MYRASSIEAVKNLARQGLGIAAMPSISVKGRGGEDLVVIAVEGGMTRDLNLILGKGRSISRMARALMEQVRSSVSASMKNPAPGEFATREGPEDD
ncbi:MAG: hypothetical protein A2133_10340 [Actinobacteria bacterium RBG_16_64_13]|nr:MAG: hypothetical protein A2133_10340 [Actinobacteria bacterium RBG_16_64_13]